MSYELITNRNYIDPLLSEFHKISGAQFSANARFNLPVDFNRACLYLLFGPGAVFYKIHRLQHIIQLDKLSPELEFYRGIPQDSFLYS